MGSSLYWMEMAVQHYCVLESIGRGRHLGMYSFGPASLQVIIEQNAYLLTHYFAPKSGFENIFGV